MKTIQVTCEHCGVHFTYERVRIDGGRYRKTCDVCRKDNRRIKQRSADMKFRENRGHVVGCGSGGNQWGDHNHSWKGGCVRVWRQLCFEAHGAVCAHCGFTPQSRETWHLLVAHHINEDRTDNRTENLRAVCKKCHQNIEHLQVRNTKGQYDGRNKTAE